MHTYPLLQRPVRSTDEPFRSDNKHNAATTVRTIRTMVRSAVVDGACVSGGLRDVVFHNGTETKWREGPPPEMERPAGLSATHRER